MSAERPRKIIVGGFIHETNTFSPTVTTYDDFALAGEFPPILVGDAVLSALQGTNDALAGFVAASERAGNWQIAPTFWCAAAPSCTVPDEVFERLAEQLLTKIAEILPADGVFLDLHGAMAVESFDDGEEEILKRVRHLVGESIPIVVALDPHANVGPGMVRYADALVAYRTYPHIDMAETGERAYHLMARLLSTGRPLAKAFRQLDFLIPTVFQPTIIEPNIEILARLAKMEADGRHQGLASASFCPCFPAADIPDCLPSVLAYADTQEMADHVADALAELVVSREASFAGRLFGPDEAVAEAMRLSQGQSRPVVIADTQDNPGAGSNSDTMGMLKALISAQARKAAIGLIFDPESASAAHEAGVGAEISLSLGGKAGIPGDSPLNAVFRVEYLSDGHVVADGPMFGGKIVELGQTARLGIGGISIVVASKRVQMMDTGFFRVAGVEPADMELLVVKSTAHFRADFAPIAHQILVATAPGSMPADPAELAWTKLPAGTRLRPMGPAFAGPVAT